MPSENANDLRCGCSFIIDADRVVRPHALCRRAKAILAIFWGMYAETVAGWPKTQGKAPPRFAEMYRRIAAHWRLFPGGFVFDIPPEIRALREVQV